MNRDPVWLTVAGCVAVGVMWAVLAVGMIR